MSEDPVGFAGGDYNVFRYVGNDPGNWVDPWGLQSVGKDGGAYCHLEDKQIWKNIEEINDPEVRKILEELLMKNKIMKFDLPFDRIGGFHLLGYIFVDTTVMKDPFLGPRTLAHEYVHYDQWQKDPLWYVTHPFERERRAKEYETDATIVKPMPRKRR